MSGMQFIVELVQALAWPSVVAILLLTQRRPISHLLRRLERVGWKDLGAWFREAGESAQRLEDDAAVLAAPPSPAVTGPPGSGGEARDADEAALRRRATVEDTIRRAFELGWLARSTWRAENPPEVSIRWRGDRPDITFGGWGEWRTDDTDR